MNKKNIIKTAKKIISEYIDDYYYDVPEGVYTHDIHDLAYEVADALGYDTSDDSTLRQIEDILRSDDDIIEGTLYVENPEAPHGRPSGTYIDAVWLHSRHSSEPEIINNNYDHLVGGDTSRIYTSST